MVRRKLADERPSRAAIPLPRQGAFDPLPVGCAEGGRISELAALPAVEGVSVLSGLAEKRGRDRERVGRTERTDQIAADVKISVRAVEHDLHNEGRIVGEII